MKPFARIPVMIVLCVMPVFSCAWHKQPKDTVEVEKINQQNKLPESKDVLLKPVKPKTPEKRDLIICDNNQEIHTRVTNGPLLPCAPVQPYTPMDKPEAVQFLKGQEPWLVSMSECDGAEYSGCSKYSSMVDDEYVEYVPCQGEGEECEYRDEYGIECGCNLMVFEKKSDKTVMVLPITFWDTLQDYELKVVPYRQDENALLVLLELLYEHYFYSYVSAAVIIERDGKPHVVWSELPYTFNLGHNHRDPNADESDIFGNIDDYFVTEGANVSFEDADKDGKLDLRLDICIYCFLISDLACVTAYLAGDGQYFSNKILSYHSLKGDL